MVCWFHSEGSGAWWWVVGTQFWRCVPAILHYYIYGLMSTEKIIIKNISMLMLNFFFLCDVQKRCSMSGKWRNPPIRPPSRRQRRRLKHAAVTNPPQQLLVASPTSIQQVQNKSHSKDMFLSLSADRSKLGLAWKNTCRPYISDLLA